MAVLVLPLMIFARIGVGVGTGKIEVAEPLKPGGIYDLPSVEVFNTGTEPSDYSLRITYHANRPQMQPPEEWFSFSPSMFHLEPGRSQTVAVKLTLPVKGVKPGDYFCFLEAYPVIETEKGVTVIAIAAAAKLYFTVIPANIWQAMYYRFLALWARYVPWSWIILGLVLAAIIVLILRKILRRYFSFQFGIRKKSESGPKTKLESDLESKSRSNLKSKPKSKPKGKSKNKLKKKKGRTK